MQKLCIRCRLHSEFKKNSNGKYICKNCAKVSVTKSRRKLKKKAIAYLGGKCEKCGYDKCPAALEFHHKSDNKEFTFSGSIVSWDKAKKELDKCQLLCSNCHREAHWFIEPEPDLFNTNI